MQDQIPLLIGKGCLLLRIQSRSEYRRGGIEVKKAIKKLLLGALWNESELYCWTEILLAGCLIASYLPVELAEEDSLGEFWDRPPCKDTAGLNPADLQLFFLSLKS